MKLAINKNAIDKIPAGDPRHGMITKTYENVDVTPEAFAWAIDQGFAFCAQHKNQRRANNNFTCAGFTAADIDHGLRLEDAVEHEFVKNYASVIYTTPSHTKEHHRFRIIFETQRDITDRQEMRDAYNGVIKKLGGDPSCKDPCRQFWGSKGSNPQVLGNTLPNDVLDELIQFGRESRNQHDYKGNDNSKSLRSTVRSQILLEPDQVVHDGDGVAHKLNDIADYSVPVRCTKHSDNNPSAVTLRNGAGVPGIFCSSCASVFYEPSPHTVPEYDFDYGLKRLTDTEADAYDEFEAEPPYLLDKEREIVGERRDIKRISERYLPPPEEHASVVFVKSPKGSGKTLWLESVVKQSKKKGESVLLIGHRQSLIQALAERLKLHPYISHIHSSERGEDKTVIHSEAPRDHYAICVDSLHVRLNPEVHKYDVVLVDEVEQVFRHLTSATVRDRRLEAYEWFRHYLDAASRVYLLDADLNRLTVETLSDFLKTKTRDVQVVINEHREQDRKVALYESNRHLESDLMQSIEIGKRCFVCSNSKAGVKRLATTMQERFGDAKKLLTITSDNSQDSAIQQFLKTIKTAILDYDVVLVSPSLGTGVDITFPDGAPLIDCVYGFFEARINTHFDIDQQLSRVRNPKEMKVWISPERFFFETHPDVVKREVESAESGVRIFLGLNPDGTANYHQNDGYLNLYANVVAMQRGSKNDLRGNFVKIKKHYGWEVVEVAIDKVAAEEGIEMAAQAKEILQQKRIQELLAAKLISKEEHKSLWRVAKKEPNLSADKKIAMDRYQIESFYLLEISEDLIESDNHGRLRTQVRNYERFMSPDASLLGYDEWESGKGFHTTDRQHQTKQKEVLAELFLSAGIINDAGVFQTDVIIMTETLGEFVANCRRRKDEIVRLFEMPVRLDIGKKPMQQLRDLLKWIGVSCKNVKIRKEGAKKIYEYNVCEDSIKRMRKIVDARSSEAKEQWHKDRDETTENRLFNEENRLKEPRTFGMSLPGLPAGRALEWSEVEY